MCRNLPCSGLVVSILTPSEWTHPESPRGSPDLLRARTDMRYKLPGCKLATALPQGSEASTPNSAKTPLAATRHKSDAWSNLCKFGFHFSSLVSRKEMPEMFCEKSETCQFAFSRSLLDEKSTSSQMLGEPVTGQSMIALPVNTGSDVSIISEVEREELRPAPLKAVADTVRSDPSSTCSSKKTSIEPDPVEREMRLCRLTLP
mmetsp:Transcript_16010/g.25553  ORF Transcript_16010/g.25553 Transcript_16010/m.25553 type:complete len:203 (+) Transcript_16010:5559-6167(+)